MLNALHFIAGSRSDDGDGIRSIYMLYTGKILSLCPEIVAASWVEHVTVGHGGGRTQTVHSFRAPFFPLIPFKISHELALHDRHLTTTCGSTRPAGTRVLNPDR